MSDHHLSCETGRRCLCNDNVIPLTWKRRRELVLEHLGNHKKFKLPSSPSFLLVAPNQLPSTPASSAPRVLTDLRPQVVHRAQDPAPRRKLWLDSVERPNSQLKDRLHFWRDENGRKIHSRRLGIGYSSKSPKLLENKIQEKPCWWRLITTHQSGRSSSSLLSSPAAPNHHFFGRLKRVFCYRNQHKADAE